MHPLFLALLLGPSTATAADDPSRLSPRIAAAEAALARGDGAEAERRLRETLAALAREGEGAAASPEAERALGLLAAALAGSGRYREAEALLARLERWLEPQAESRSGDLAELRRRRARLLRLLGDPAGAESLLEEARRLDERHGDPVAAAETLSILAELARDRDDLAAARRAYGTALLRLEEAFGDCEARLLPLLDALAALAAEAGEPEARREHLARAAACAARLGRPDALRRQAELESPP